MAKWNVHQGAHALHWKSAQVATLRDCLQYEWCEYRFVGRIKHHAVVDQALVLGVQTKYRLEMDAHSYQKSTKILQVCIDAILSC